MLNAFGIRAFSKTPGLVNKIITICTYYRGVETDNDPQCKCEECDKEEMSFFFLCNARFGMYQVLKTIYSYINT